MTENKIICESNVKKYFHLSNIYKIKKEAGAKKGGGEDDQHGIKFTGPNVQTME